MYKDLPKKPWGQILADNEFEWQPPITVHLPIQPLHSPDLVHVDSALNVCRRSVLRRLSVTEGAARAVSDPVMLIQTALGEAPFVPDWRYTKLHLADGQYPVAEAEYYLSDTDLMHRFEYGCTPPRAGGQSILWIHGTLRNDGDKQREGQVHFSISFPRESDVFDYHYIPFYWDKSKWRPGDGIRLDQNRLLRGDHVLGRITPGATACTWVDQADFDEHAYDWSWTRNFVHPSMRLPAMRNVLRVRADLAPGESKSFTLALLTQDEAGTPSDDAALAGFNRDTARSAALAHFAAVQSDRTATLTCAANKWGEIFTTQQISILQLLIDFPEERGLIPTQGGSSERHYVWVWEATCMLWPLLKLGHFKEVRRALDFIFSLQDGGCAPEGRFTTTDGAVGTTGPRWICTTGSALALAAEYARHAGDATFLDEYLPRILRAADWIVHEIGATRKPGPDGKRPASFGLMPFGCATDGDIGHVVVFTDAYTFWGLENAALLLESLGHARAGGIRAEVERYRADIRESVKTLTRPDGYIDRKIVTGDPREVIYRKFEYICGAVNLAYCGVLDVRSDVFNRYVEVFEDRIADGYFAGKMDAEILYIILGEYLWQDVYLRRGEWKKAFMALQVCLKYGLTQDTHQAQERFSKCNPAFAPWQPNGGGSGRILDMMVKSFCFEDGESLTLLGGIPFAWLQQNGVTKLAGVWTPGGRLTIEATMIDREQCELRVTSTGATGLPRTLRFPDHVVVTAAKPSSVALAPGRATLPAGTREATFVLRE